MSILDQVQEVVRELINGPGVPTQNPLGIRDRLPVGSESGSNGGERLGAGSSELTLEAPGS